MISLGYRRRVIIACVIVSEGALGSTRRHLNPWSTNKAITIDLAKDLQLNDLHMTQKPERLLLKVQLENLILKNKTLFKLEKNWNNSKISGLLVNIKTLKN